MTSREIIIEVINKLFTYTDARLWNELQNEVFFEKVYMDMSSMGGPASEASSVEICNRWEQGFRDLDAIFHLGGNYLVKIEEPKATVLAYALATHYRANAKKGKTRQFAGTYEFGLINTENGWRINRFVYNLKFMDGNRELI